MNADSGRPRRLLRGRDGRPPEDNEHEDDEGSEKPEPHVLTFSGSHRLCRTLNESALSGRRWRVQFARTGSRRPFKRLVRRPVARVAEHRKTPTHLNQCSHMASRNSYVSGKPEAEPSTESMPQWGQTTVRPPAGSSTHSVIS